MAITPLSLMSLFRLFRRFAEGRSVSAISGFRRAGSDNHQRVSFIATSSILTAAFVLRPGSLIEAASTGEGGETVWPATKDAPPCKQRVLVTGGANGIGRSIVEAFLQEGADVVYVDLQELGAARGFGCANNDTRPVGAHFVRCDVSEPGEVEQAIAEAIRILGGLDVLVNNVGAHVEAGVPCHQASLEAWEKMIAVNLRSYFLFCKYALRDAFVPMKGGAIVNIGSVHGFQNGPGLPIYAAAKGGVLSFTRQLAVEYAPMRIRANVVVPGTINTPMNLTFFEAKDELTDRSPAGRWGSPEEVASVVVFLASSRAAFVTGESIAVDGGLLAKGTWADNERPGLHEKKTD